MSGIVGVFNRNGEPVRREMLDRMCQAIQHRGPHGRVLWSDGPVGFGHVLLHTTEESLREEQPFSLDSKVWITADARIDDRDGLIDLLKSRVDYSETLKEATDVALLLHAYHAWGVDCVDHIIGVFAASIWDGRTQQLVCLRDHIGIKPFYYAHTSQRIVFASEAKGILASGLVPQRIYEPRIADFLVRQLEGVDQTCTFFEGVVRLPPAHRLVCSIHRIEIGKYWTLDTTTETHFKDQRDYVHAFRDHFYKAVQCRLRGAEPVASMLSGGLDSSSIVAVARDIRAQNGGSNLRTLSVVNTKDPVCPETTHINEVLGQGSLDPYIIDVADYGLYGKEFDDILHTTDDLFDRDMLIPQIIYFVALSRGINVVLDGVDGDIVTGQPGNHIAYLLQRNKFKAAIKEAKLTSGAWHGYWGNPYSLFYRACRRAYTPNYLRVLRRWWREWRSDHSLDKVIYDTIINKKFASRVNILDRIITLSNHFSNSNSINLRLNHADLLNHPYLTVGLERYDSVASKYSIEPRHPFLDKRLIEFCLSLPWEQKIQGGWTKLITRHGMKGLLPEEVIWRRGREHLAPKVMAERLSSEIGRKTDSLPETLKNIACYVDIEIVRSAYQSYNSSSKEPDINEGIKVLDAYALMTWLSYWGNMKFH